MKYIILTIVCFFPTIFFAQSLNKSNVLSSRPEDTITKEFLNKRFKSNQCFKLDSINSVVYNHLSLDTLCIYNEYFTYDVFGRELFSYQSTLDIELDSITSRCKIEFEYYENPDSLVNTFSNYSFWQQDYINDYCQTWTFDENGFNKNYTIYAWENTSNIWRKNQSVDTEYDNSGNLVDYTYLDFANSENNPSYGEKTINEYNGQNCLLNSLTLNYDNQTYSWDSLSKITCTFNTEGKKLSELTSEYNYVHLQWNNTGYTENTYSEELLETSIVYNYQNGDLINYEKFEYAYDEYGRIITYSDYQWKPILSLWFNNYQENYFYENNGYSVDYLSFEMNNDGISIPSQKVTYFFDLNDLLISSTGFSWNPSSSEWDNQSRLHFDYDDSLRMTYMLREYWDLSCLCWIDEAIDEYTYDVNGNIIYYGQKAWNPERNSWDLYYEEKDYNDDVFFNDMVLPLYAVNLEEFGNMLLTAKYYATDAPCVRYNRYYYTKFEVNLTPIENKNTEAYLFPNPASSTVSVRLPEGLLSADFYLFDIQGRCIIEKSIQTESQISISELSNGLYFYKVIVGVDTFSGKLIKE